MEKAQGVTLTELLIVIAIMGIIATVAYPSYQSYTIKTRRGDAQAKLIKAQLKQSSLHILNPNYSDKAAELGLPTAHSYYQFSIVSATATSYLIKAVAKAESSQQKDEIACQSLFVDQNGNHTSDGSTDNNQCW